MIQNDVTIIVTKYLNNDFISFVIIINYHQEIYNKN